MAAVFRLHVARVNGGDVQLYESAEAFESDLFSALLDVELHKAQGWPRRMLYAWKSYRSKGEEEEFRLRVQRVIAAQKMTDGEWVDLHPVLVPPRLEFVEES